MRLCYSGVRKLRTGARVAPGSVTLDAAAARCGYSLYMLYWYKSANTDTCARVAPDGSRALRHFVLLLAQEKKKRSVTRTPHLSTFVVLFEKKKIALLLAHPISGLF